MKKSSADDQFSLEEISRRRDEVVRRMANTPPQPKPTTPNHRPKKEEKAGVDRGAHKRRADRED